jgi:hypothetical protein
MADAERDVEHAHLPCQVGGAAVQVGDRISFALMADFNLLPADRPDAAAQGFDQGFFGSEQPRGALERSADMLPFGGGVDAFKNRFRISGFSCLKRLISTKSIPLAIFISA